MASFRAPIINDTVTFEIKVVIKHPIIQGGVRFFVPVPSSISVVSPDKEIVFFDCFDGQLVIKLPYSWEAKGDEKTLTQIASKLAVHIVDKLREENYITAKAAKLKLKIEFQKR